MVAEVPAFGTPDDLALRTQRKNDKTIADCRLRHASSDHAESTGIGHVFYLFFGALGVLVAMSLA
jgi:hypothetical protein